MKLQGIHLQTLHGLANLKIYQTVSDIDAWPMKPRCACYYDWPRIVGEQFLCSFLPQLKGKIVEPIHNSIIQWYSITFDLVIRYLTFDHSCWFHETHVNTDMARLIYAISEIIWKNSRNQIIWLNRRKRERKIKPVETDWCQKSVNMSRQQTIDDY